MNRERILRDGPMCSSGKRGWASEAEAARVLRAARTNRLDDPDHGRVRGSVEEACYECPVCHQWHLSSSSKPRRRGELSAIRNRRR